MFINDSVSVLIVSFDRVDHIFIFITKDRLR